MKLSENEKSNIVSRPPVVVIMGHIDHGKSTLLDYIRKTNMVDKEVGGITQHISAYEVLHKDKEGVNKKITFLDTPGHEAFSHMRERGAIVADIAVLVVSAEDSVKAQTVEAYNTILEAKIPFVVAINKIDKPGSNVEKTKIDLLEKEIYLEGFGGQVPYAEISAKVGTGVDNLLEIILLVAELESFTGDKSKNATGVVIESNLDTKRGVSATMVIKDGTIKKGMFVVVDEVIAGTRIMEDFLGKDVDELSFSSPVKIIGFNKMPIVGEIFQTFENKKEAEKMVAENEEKKTKQKTERISDMEEITDETKIIPVVIKTDVAGTIEAIEKEISKIKKENVFVKIIGKGVGAISESDVKSAGGDKESIILGFNVKTERSAIELGESLGIMIKSFDIIYKISDWLEEELEKRRPRKQIEEITGKAKIIRFFSRVKDRQVVGGKVLEGKISLDENVKISRREFEIGKGKISEIQQNKVKSKDVLEGNEFGMMIDSKAEIAPGDIIEAFIMVEK
ncbi:MAG: translation initiation factor IF-2 [Candidatus Paceibacterota bacterium]|jgi:translation initiation factor IF-2